MSIMKNILTKSVSVLSLILIIVLTSCTDLTETINSEVTADQYFQSDQEFISALGESYAPLSGWGSSGSYASLAHVTSDEAIITQKGQDWFDGGVWIRLQRHTYSYDEVEINNAWVGLFSGVNNCNRLIFQFESLVESGDVSGEDAASFIAELRVLRGFYYYLLLDKFGNVPIVDQFEGADENPTQPGSNFQEGRTALFNFIESSILDNIGQLSEDTNATYGRVNKWVAHMILGKLYLNAEVYTGTTRWQDAADQMDTIINSGNYSLNSDYAANFSTNNSGSPELMFVVPYDEVFLTGFQLHHMTLHYSSQATYNMEAQPWNGYAAMEETYMRYIDSDQNPGPQGEVVGSDGTPTTGTQDSRLSNFLVGDQFNAQGDSLFDPGATDADPNGPLLTYTPHIQNLEPNGLRQAGARVGKFEIEQGATANLSNDYPIFRYADVLLMKAEALWRQNSGDSEALRLVNLIRERAGVTPFTSLDADKLLAERGREMFWEQLRRQDLIRFDGKQGATRFNDPWEFKEQSDPTRNVFPIPRDQLEANSNLVQNPGYQGG